MGLVDRFLKIVISKKLSITVLATILLTSSFIDGEQWKEIVKIYLMSQGVVDGVKIFKNN